jgi:transcriptional regulator with XRE-family HTH domain
MSTIDQVKAARKLLGWSQARLASEAGVDQTTVMTFETGKKRPSALTISLIKRAVEGAGVEFTNGEQPGARLASHLEHRERSAKDYI